MDPAVERWGAIVAPCGGFPSDCGERCGRRMTTFFLLLLLLICIANFKCIFADGKNSPCVHLQQTFQMQHKISRFFISLANHCLDNRNKSQILYCDEIMKLSHQWNKKELPVFVLPKEYSACCRKLSYATSKTPRLSEGYHGLRCVFMHIIKQVIRHPPSFLVKRLDRRVWIECPINFFPQILEFWNQDKKLEVYDSIPHKGSRYRKMNIRYQTSMEIRDHIESWLLSFYFNSIFLSLFFLLSSTFPFLLVSEIIILFFHELTPLFYSALILAPLQKGLNLMNLNFWKLNHGWYLQGVVSGWYLQGLYHNDFRYLQENLNCLNSSWLIWDALTLVKTYLDFDFLAVLRFIYMHQTKCMVEMDETQECESHRFDRSIPSLQKKLDQLHAGDMQHALAKLPSKLHMLASVDILAHSLNNSSFLGLSACQLQAVEQVFFLQCKTSIKIHKIYYSAFYFILKACVARVFRHSKQQISCLQDGNSNFHRRLRYPWRILSSIQSFLGLSQLVPLSNFLLLILPYSGRIPPVLPHGIYTLLGFCLCWLLVLLGLRAHQCFGLGFNFTLLKEINIVFLFAFNLFHQICLLPCLKVFLLYLGFENKALIQGFQSKYYLNVRKPSLKTLICCASYMEKDNNLRVEKELTGFLLKFTQFFARSCLSYTKIRTNFFPKKWMQQHTIQVEMGVSASTRGLELSHTSTRGAKVDTSLRLKRVCKSIEAPRNGRQRLEYQKRGRGLVKDNMELKGGFCKSHVALSCFWANTNKLFMVIWGNQSKESRLWIANNQCMRSYYNYCKSSCMFWDTIKAQVSSPGTINKPLMTAKVSWLWEIEIIKPQVSWLWEGRNHQSSGLLAMGKGIYISKEGVREVCLIWKSSEGCWMCQGNFPILVMGNIDYLGILWEILHAVRVPGVRWASYPDFGVLNGKWAINKFCGDFNFSFLNLKGYLYSIYGTLLFHRFVWRSNWKIFDDIKLLLCTSNGAKLNGKFHFLYHQICSEPMVLCGHLNRFLEFIHTLFGLKEASNFIEASCRGVDAHPFQKREGKMEVISFFSCWTWVNNPYQLKPPYSFCPTTSHTILRPQQYQIFFSEFSSCYFFNEVFQYFLRKLRNICFSQTFPNRGFLQMFVMQLMVLWDMYGFSLKDTFYWYEDGLMGGRGKMGINLPFKILSYYTDIPLGKYVDLRCKFLRLKIPFGNFSFFMQEWALRDKINIKIFQIRYQMKQKGLVRELKLLIQRADSRPLLRKASLLQGRILAFAKAEITLNNTIIKKKQKKKFVNLTEG
ncbi:hypothetical protein VP01_1807g2 [Puccinia sorghi]|uniref:Uncharacterized protein n=1 Tax=Puccinia sorghi TaxID=27349 RepID=A0A0L6VG30_9BASI|nr:hypothetical protein VP01_1807g2 [Puccinia sorghi]